MDLLLLAVIAVAVVDWIAVHRGLAALEALAKPAVMVLLLAWAVTADAAPGAPVGWVVAALALSLVGDVALLPRPDAFIVGLGAFLLGHLAYVVALASAASTGPSLVGVLLVVPAALLVGRRIAMAAGRSHGPVLAGAVVVYVCAVGATAVLAVGTGMWPVVVGGMLFAASDGILGWNRFVAPLPHGRVAVHVTYHLAQVGLAQVILGT